MPRSPLAPVPARRAVALGASLAALATGLALAPTGAVAAAAPPVFVSEILANPVGHDDFEYFEITNPTGAPVSLAQAGITFAYTYADSTDTTRDVPLTVESDVTVAPGGSAVLWLSYRNAAGTLDSFARSVEEFRAATGASADTQVVRVTGQAGMANGGDRGIRVLGPEGILTWSHYPAGSMADDLGVDFAVPAAVGQPARVLATTSPMTPGTVAPEALQPEGPGEPEEPGDPGDPEDVAGLEPDPTLSGATLQVTELLPNSRNVGSSDGFEFVEVYNAGSEPVDFADYALTYLYPQDYTTNTNEALWPSTPRDVTIPAGETLVLWIKNGPNDDLTDADFNAEFGSDLTLGEDLVEIRSAGMANGSPRGIDIRTNTGFSVNRAYYNMAGASDVADNRGIQYTASADDQGLQTIVAGRDPSPGRVQVDQVPGGLIVPPADAEAPQVADRTGAEIDPAAGLAIDLAVTDDVQVRTVTLELRNDVDDEPVAVNLVRDPADPTAYRHTVHPADVAGKSWYEYVVVATDGTRTTTTEARRVDVAGANDDPVRLNVTDGEFVGGTTSISAAGETFPPELDLTIDEQVVETRPSLERSPHFVFEYSQTDFYFRNGVRIGDEILAIFDEGSYERTETLSVPVPLEHITQGEPLSVDVWAGTKAGPWIDEDENNDDFVISGMRLVLPDGRTLRPAGYDDPTRIVQMGDSAGKNDFFVSEFTLPDDAYSAVAHDWDTTATTDGAHTVAATDGTDSASAEVLVDNTAPTVTPSVEEGRVYQGEFVVDAEITDGSGSGVADVVALLDGKPVALGTTTSSTTLAAGDHVLSVTATDAVGNVTTSTTTFVVPEEQPGADGLAPAEGAEVEAGSAILQAEVSDPTGDALDVSFREGYRMQLGDDAVVAGSGTTTDAGALERTPEAARSAAELPTTAGLAPVASTDELPYYTFDVTVPADAGADASVRLTWDGTADADAQVILYALAADGSSWIEVARHLTTTDGEEFALTGTVGVADAVRDGVVSVLVQHSEGYASPDLSTRDTAVTPRHADDTPRSEYDFSFAWESDTQYYNEEFTQHQSAIHDYVLDQREEQNIGYLFHTGDIVDDWDQPYQWQNASPQYQRLDDAGFPYGVLAGNHDVGNRPADYSVYSQHFGEARFAGNPWYGGSYKDNRGHYDLVSAGGIDFLMLYMGWDPGDEEIAWMNEVLAAHPERVAVVSLHEFLLTTGGLGPIPQRIMDEVVATNPNVEMVLSGHYHDAYTRIDAFDDDGDGVPDRDVHSMLFDYQGLPEGGQGFLRLMQFDNEGEQMRVRTFSPSLDRYNSEEPSLLGPADDPWYYQDFELDYADLGIAPSDKSLTTTGFTADVLTTREIGAVTDVPSGGVAAVPWDLETPGVYSWYAVVSDPHGGVETTAVRSFRLVAAPVDPTDPTDPGDGDDGSDGGSDGGSGGAPGPGGDVGGHAPGGPGGSGSGPGAGAGGGTGPGSGGWVGDSRPGSGKVVGRGPLPDTGSTVSPALLAGALGLLGAGTALLLAARRRRAD
ncbi:lamin tail domain-containing protein [Nocardioides zeae]|uniref:Lamin tail domain-containing protein n=1 Tax=Nocardioides imazamoxiresistens TaxID=3231893 RepID=A0ABU3PVQ5_9ACTN|nr:lamin tail domain-containing protein [Nocardioides zeae]MDT9592830.1 lamin tail domain-containing protein [Nocardioides zeae]